MAASHSPKLGARSRPGMQGSGDADRESNISKRRVFEMEKEMLTGTGSVRRGAQLIHTCRFRRCCAQSQHQHPTHVGEERADAYQTGTCVMLPQLH
ncbi:uncharacterized protein MYCGRDRAFT_103029 [Zymoseptoria tritici IPO323]|uniref:Uncharacterized protein n=1 Tax=Zymoseptoria tritici (strain CBS 115943 / IPO323) TaxID=336722 RepID=F9X2K2_ZYMTI|nr:uncharacterized protein MYCGRDRAFT_103029 [Zymoseptoria tritici IPO323]EGP90765.1 hypothetical protein MYCGRDRAFT_103029 [Zymoseptoria tritici IPO323]